MRYRHLHARPIARRMCEPRVRSSLGRLLASGRILGLSFSLRTMRGISRRIVSFGLAICSLHLPPRDYLRHGTCNSFAENIDLERDCDDGAFVFFRDFRFFFPPVACACAPLHLQPPPSLNPPHRGGVLHPAR